jgi:NAD(P)-dependent dehydrogenase (short-subunit alcohol dehydrogenase family)
MSGTLTAKVALVTGAGSGIGEAAAILLAARDEPDDGEDPAEAMMRGKPAGGSGTPDAVAHAAVYLASDEAAFAYGTVIDVDGGTAVAVSRTVDPPG